MRVRYVLPCLAGCWAVAGQQAECTAEENGLYYDLTSLKAKHYHEFKSDTGSRREFKLNVCSNVVSEIWKIDNPDTVGALYRGDGNDVSIGTVNTTLRIVDSNPLLILTNGSPCKEGSSPIRASTVIRFICDNNVFGTGKPQLISQMPPDDEDSCAFFFEWRTHVACPTTISSRFSATIAVLAAIALILFLSYIIIGVLYRRFALGYRGLDQIPRLSLIKLSSIPQSLEDIRDWFRDIQDHLRGGARDLWPRSNDNGLRSTNWAPRRSDGFAPLAREEEQALFRDGPDNPDTRFSLDDDVDHAGARELPNVSPPVPAKDSGKPSEGGAIRL